MPLVAQYFESNPLLAHNDMPNNTLSHSLIGQQLGVGGMPAAEQQLEESQRPLNVREMHHFITKWCVHYHHSQIHPSKQSTNCRICFLSLSCSSHSSHCLCAVVSVLSLLFCACSTASRCQLISGLRGRTDFLQSRGLPTPGDSPNVYKDGEGVRIERGT